MVSNSSIWNLAGTLRGRRALIKYGVLNARPILALLLTDRHFAFRFAGGQIYLNVRESRMMLDRALGLFESGFTEAVSALLKLGATFIDIGGNKGDFALLAASKVGNSGKVLCFEPEPRNCQWVRKSVELNHYRNIGVFELALSDSRREAKLYLRRKSGFHTLVGPSRNSEEKPRYAENGGVITVRTRTLDDFLSELHNGKVDMIKIDVEGAEFSLLKWARRTLAQNPDVILLVELHPALGVNLAEIYGFLSDMGFSVFREGGPLDARLSHARRPLGVFACRQQLQVKTNPFPFLTRGLYKFEIRS
jgi:FkbM family methyltransferase